MAETDARDAELVEVAARWLAEDDYGVDWVHLAEWQRQRWLKKAGDLLSAVAPLIREQERERACLFVAGSDFPSGSEMRRVLQMIRQRNPAEG